MGKVVELRPASEKEVSEASLRAGELGDALRCIDKLIGADEEMVSLLSNDLRGLIRVLSREADAIGERISLQI